MRIRSAVMDIIKKKFGERLKAIRNLKGYTQETLAEKIGINLRQLARIEAGESFVKADTLFRICSILDVNPSVLFDFELFSECRMTGTDDNLQFNVIKNDNLVKLVPRNETVNEIDIDEEISFDSKMLIMAQKMQKNIYVDEIEDGVILCSKTYTPSGEIKSDTKITSINNDVEQLKENLSKIENDKKKLEYMNLAFNSLYCKKALEQLKFLIKGLELMQK